MDAEMNVRNIKVGERFRKEMGDIDSLAASIELNGLLQPIVVFSDGKLIAGARRLLAFKKLRRKTIPVRVVDLDNPIQAEHDENEERKQFTVSERVAIAEALAELAGERRGRPAAEPEEEGMAEGLFEEERPAEEISRNCDTFQPGQRTDEAVAKKAGFSSKDEYRRAKAVVANGAPELVEAMDKEEISVSAAATLANLPQDQQREVVAAGPEVATAKAKEVREQQAKGREAAKVTKHPHSERLYAWLRSVSGETEVIEIKLGGIKAMLAEPDKWNWEEIEGHILPALEDLAGTISSYVEEVRNAVQQRNA